MSAADLSSSSTPEAAGDVQADSPAAEAGVGEGEGGAGEGQQDSHEEEVVEGGSGAGVPVIKPAPVYNKEGVVVEVTQDIVDAVDKFTPPAGFVRKGSRDKSYMYSVGVYVEHTESRRTDHKYYCLAHSKCRRSSKVGTVEEFMFKEGVRDILDKLDTDLVGLIPVKMRVRQIAALLVLDKMRGKLGFDTAVPSLHMCFTGAPGTGKTTVALRMGQILQRMGYCRQGHVVVATRDDLVGQYVGHTAPKTKEMIKKAFGGILLVDEAYYLYNAANDKDYGQESIEILLNVMEEQKDDLIVTLAGYKDRMDRFFSYIPGMSSRVGNHIDFPNYLTDELVEIAVVMARDLEYFMDESALKVFKLYIEKRMKFPFFSNARTVRNAMDRARMNSAIRVFNEAVMNEDTGGMVSEKDLAVIMDADFQVLLDELLEYEAIGKLDAIVA